jgi:hypothetical protein
LSNAFHEAAAMPLLNASGIPPVRLDWVAQLAFNTTSP